jgi:hypothetical protein
MNRRRFLGGLAALVVAPAAVLAAKPFSVPARKPHMEMFMRDETGNVSQLFPVDGTNRWEFAEAVTLEAHKTYVFNLRDAYDAVEGWKPHG